MRNTPDIQKFRIIFLFYVIQTIFALTLFSTNMCVGGILSQNNFSKQNSGLSPTLEEFESSFGNHVRGIQGSKSNLKSHILKL